MLLGEPVGSEAAIADEPRALPVGTAAFVTEWLARRGVAARHFAARLREAAGAAPADLPAGQALTSVVRMCFAQRHMHVMRAVWGQSVREFGGLIDSLAAEAFDGVSTLPPSRGWRHELLFEAVGAGGSGFTYLRHGHAAAFLGGGGGGVGGPAGPGGLPTGTGGRHRGGRGRVRAGHGCGGRGGGRLLAQGHRGGWHPKAAAGPWAAGASCEDRGLPRRPRPARPPVGRGGQHWPRGQRRGVAGRQRVAPRAADAPGPHTARQALANGHQPAAHASS